MNNFEFPANRSQYQRVKDYRDLRNRLEAQSKAANMPSHYFRISTQKHMYLYARCKKNCSANLKYKMLEGESVFTLIMFQNSHRHQVVAENTHIINFMRGLPSSLSTKSMKIITSKTFSITPSKFYYLFRKLWYQGQNFIKLLEQLDHEGNQTKYSPYPLNEDQIPDIFLTSTKRMIENFQKFGDIVMFDVTYHLVRQRKINPQKGNAQRYGLGLFLGKNELNKTIPFAIALINQQTQNSFERLFLSFIEIMKKAHFTFISDEQLAIQSALQHISISKDWQGTHLLDHYHILKNITKRTKNQSLIRALRDSLNAQTIQQFDNLLKLAKQVCNNQGQLDLYQRFKAKSYKYCISQVQRQFCGINISTSYCEQVNGLIKRHIQYEKPFSFVVKKVLHILEDLQKKNSHIKLCSVIYEEIFQWKGLKLLRNSLSDVLFQKILKRYIKSLSLVLKDTSEGWENNQDDQIIRIKNEKYVCSCQIEQKTGLPCKHILKIVQQSRENILAYINKRWIINWQNAIIPNIFIPLGRPRLSQRNHR